MVAIVKKYGMNEFSKFKFYFDGVLIKPSGLLYSYSNKDIVYYLELAENYFEKRNGRFHFTAEFNCSITCDITMNESQINLVSNMPNHDIIFDGFKSEENCSINTLYLKSLETVTQIIHHVGHTGHIEKQGYNLRVNIFEWINAPAHSYYPPLFNDPSPVQKSGSKSYPVSCEIVDPSSSDSSKGNFFEQFKPYNASMLSPSIHSTTRRRLLRPKSESNENKTRFTRVKPPKVNCGFLQQVQGTRGDHMVTVNIVITLGRFTSPRG